jgi:hypothetical protein
MQERLPRIANEAEFECWRSHPDRWVPLVTDISRGEGITASICSQFGNSTNLVVNLDDELILKLFPPIYRMQFISERNALQHMAGRLGVPIPSIEADGERDGWSWLIITKLGGVVGSTAWPHLPERAKEDVLEEIGTATSATVYWGCRLAICLTCSCFLRTHHPSFPSMRHQSFSQATGSPKTCYSPKIVALGSSQVSSILGIL